MKTFVIAACLALSTLPMSVGAQTYDPWANYDVRNIRDLRDQAADRRERLRDLAQKSHAQRRDPSLPAVTREGLTAARVKSAQPLTETREIIASSPRPPARPIPVWTGPQLTVTDADRARIHGLFEAEVSEAAEAQVVQDEEFGAPILFETTLLTFSDRPVPRPLPTWTGPHLDPSETMRAELMRFKETDFVRRDRKFPNIKYENGYVVAGSTLRARVNVSQQRMVLLDGEKVIAEWPVSTGRRGYESTRGTFKVSFLSRNHKSRQYNMAPMPCAVFYHNGEAFHGTNAVGQLGSKASHGCVRLATKNACMLYDLVAERGKESLTVEVFD